MLTKAPVRPPFPTTGYSASNKRTYAPDGCWDYYTGGGSLTYASILGQMTLYPFYIRYDVPAGGLEMKSAYAANGYSQSGNSNTAQWGMYRVGTSIYDSSLLESVTVTDTSSYQSPTKTQTLTLAYPAGWYIASIVFTSQTGNGTISTNIPKNEPVFGSLYNYQVPASAMTHLGVTGQTSGLPSNLNSATLVSIGAGASVGLRY
jgi:hypothetical protein